jgi:aspartate aminotransferase
MHLAQRVGRIGESATREVSRRAKALKAQGIEILDLSAGEPDFASPAVAVEAARLALAEGKTKYTDGRGIPELRAALAERYRRDYAAPWSAEQVQVTCGGKMALFELFEALVDRGGRVVMPSPCWVSFPEQVRFAGGEPVLVPTRGETGFAIEAEPVLAAIDGNTRAVLINSPSNPTGGIVSAAALRAIAEGCRERGVVLVADETYERFVYDGQAHASAASLAAEMPETVVLVGSFSKTYAMTGWRLGYVFAPAPLLEALVNIQSHATSNPTTFAMYGALAAINGAEAEVEAMLAEYRARRALLVERLGELPGVTCASPAGAFYAFPDVTGTFRPGRSTPQQLAQFLLEEARVAVVPGEGFGSREHVRLSFACSRETLGRALDRMAEALSA